MNVRTRNPAAGTASGAAARARATIARAPALVETALVSSVNIGFSSRLVDDPASSASVGTELDYRGAVNAYFGSNPFNLSLPSYTLWNLRAGAIYGDWTFMAFVHNAGNTRAQVSAINSSQDPHALLTVQPRTVGLTVTRKF